MLFETVSLVSLLAAPATLPPDRGQLTIEKLLDIVHPSNPIWSPDGRYLAYVGDRSAVQNLHVTPADGNSDRVLTDFEDGGIDGFFWRPDASALYFGRNGDLWTVARSGGDARAVWTTPETEGGFALSPDGKHIAFSRRGDIWVHSITGGADVQLTTAASIEAGPVWSPDGSRIAFSAFSRTRREDAPEFSGAKILFTRFEPSFNTLAVVTAGGGSRVDVDAVEGWKGTPRWLGSERVVFNRVSGDVKTREIIVADASSGTTRVLRREEDEKFFSLNYLGADPVPSPDGRWIAFISDREGWDHLYVLAAEGGDPTRLTAGDQEVRRLSWSRDSRAIAFDTNSAEHPGRRQLSAVRLGDDGRWSPASSWTSGPGTRTGPVWSPDGKYVVFQHTDSRHPANLRRLEAEPGGAERVLSRSLPETVDRDQLIEPELVHYPSSDGSSSVPAYLLTPRGLDRSRRHPAILWVHGDGINQNYDGWHIQREYAVYYSFHQYLVQQGYIVLAVDYRGSIGYGKKWRQGHYRDLGGKDYQDIADGAAYLKTLDFVDPDRIGIWGLSYGGFMTLQALTVTPKLFAAGIDVAGVQDWRYWYRDPDGPWIKGRMGKPADNPELYRRTAPIERIDRIVRPLLILHGTSDVNVPFLESVRLVDVLLTEGKDFEFVMYPGEFHYFHRAKILRDAWTRVEAFFDEHLKGVQ